MRWWGNIQALYKGTIKFTKDGAYLFFGSRLLPSSHHQPWHHRSSWVKGPSFLQLLSSLQLPGRPRPWSPWQHLPWELWCHPWLVHRLSSSTRRSLHLSPALLVQPPVNLLMYEVLDKLINKQRVYHKIWSKIGNDHWPMNQRRDSQHSVVLYFFTTHLVGFLGWFFGRSFLLNILGRLGNRLVNSRRGCGGFGCVGNTHWLIEVRREVKGFV